MGNRWPVEKLRGRPGLYSDLNDSRVQKKYPSNNMIGGTQVLVLAAGNRSRNHCLGIQGLCEIINHKTCGRKW